MRVALIGPSITQKGGIASVLRGLESYLAKSGVDVLLIPTTADGRWSGFVTFVRAWLSVIRIGLLRDCDLVHLHMASRGSCLRKSLLAVTCVAFRLPYILHLHGGGFADYYLSLDRVSRACVVFVFSRASRVVALSPSWQRWIQSSIGVANVDVVFNGVPAEVLSAASASAIKTVLFLGKLGQQKGVDDLLSAASQLQSLLPDVVVEFGGDGDIEFYRNRAAGMTNVRFLGWLDASARSAALARAAIFCLPSWREGLPMSILEAMSAGLPVISTPIGGIPDAVEDGVTGLLVPPGDVKKLVEALHTVLSTPELAMAMGQNGKSSHAERFSLDAMGHKCLLLYERCCRVSEQPI
ncbi:glycosyltransferase family 4 protein [Paraburkholderia sp. Ac-20336]|uniref:glycosyltransferase family 4 protein n=1 Tax=unclassified Paraburkholderia TaxID=2615204 RepID=UPI00141F77AC|nr:MULTISPECIES: glycosyltransferase family 4 protein [unclassified Paraburkholderia]MBN3804554.1 glycosyltransferase family 4 protein [Paraburkholderia sp. Ac-20336]NIF80959.1 glycosyltransferase family 4 protein [Paraburkholderia sp. Cy-641]